MIAVGAMGDEEATDAQAVLAALGQAQRSLAAELEELAAAKQDLLAAPEALIPTLAAPWINYGGGYAGARYFRTAERVVAIEGLVQAPGGSPTSGVALFTLLPGYRPAATLMFHTWSAGGACRIDVQPGGEVVLQNGNTAFTSLGGISFVAEG